MPDVIARKIYPQMPVSALEAILAAWRKSTAKAATTLWVEKACHCAPGSSRRYLADVKRLGLVSDDGVVKERGLSLAAGDASRAQQAALATVSECYDEEARLIKNGAIGSYENLIFHLRGRGYDTRSAAGNIARLMCYVLRRAGLPVPEGAPGS